MTLTDTLQPVLEKKFPAALVAASLLLTAPALLASPARAQSADHLSPGLDAVAGYQQAIIKVLDVFSNGPVLMVLIEPSFRPEYAVGLDEKDGAWRLFTATAGEPIWPKVLEDKPYDKIGAHNCRLPVPTAFAESISSVWTSMVRQTGEGGGNNIAGVDGTNYYFSTMVDDKLVIGMAWDQPPESKLGQFEDIALAMYALCKHHDDASLAELSHKVAALNARIQQDIEK